LWVLLIGCLAYLHCASFYQLYNKLFRPIYKERGWAVNGHLKFVTIPPL
jgi:hypothetical protein